MSLSLHPNVLAYGEQVDAVPLAEGQLLDVAIQAARGLGHAYRHGVTVGDFSVLIAADGTAKVGGFDVGGFAALVRELNLATPVTELTMADVTAELLERYRREHGRPYPRPEPKPVVRTADELNNHALVLADLGRTQDALATFEQALAVHPGHPEATYNNGILAWRLGVSTDDRLLAALAAIGADYPRGLVHLERGDAASALPLLLTAGKDDAAFRYAVAAERPYRLQPRTVTVRPGITTDSLHVGPGHEVDHVRLSADGRIAVTAGNETLQAWDTRTGKLLHEALEHAGGTSALHVTADGQFSLSGARNGVVQWRSLRDGEVLRQFRTGDDVVDVRALADGKTAVISVRGQFQVWDLGEGRLERAVDHEGPMFAAAVSADGRRAVSGGHDHVVRLWDLTTGECLLRLKGHTSWVRRLRLSADGRVAISSGDYDPVLRVWDLDAGRCRHLLRGHVREARGLDIGADGRFALSAGGTDRTVRLWDLEAGRCLRTFASDYDDTAALSADGRVASAGGMTGEVRVWDIPAPTGYAAPARPCGPRTYAEVLALQTAASEVLDQAEHAVAAEDFGTAHTLLLGLRADRRHDRTPRSIRTWQRLSAHADRVGVDELLTARVLAGHTDRVASICAAPDSRVAISGGRDGALRVWDLESGACRSVLTGHTGTVQSVAISADGRTAVSGGRDKTVRVWDLDSGECSKTLQGHTSLVYAVSVSANARRAISSARDADRLLVWDLPSGEILHRLNDHTGGVATVAMTADGTLAVSGSHDGTARVWNLDTGDCVRVLDDSHKGFAVDAVRLTSDGSRAFTVGSMGRAQLWDLTSGECLRTFAPGWSNFRDVQLSSDDRYALVAHDRLVRLYDLTTGEPAYDLPELPDETTAVCLTPDARFALAASRDKTIHTWELTWHLTVS